MTTVHLSTDNSKIEVISSLKKAYSGEGVPTVNVASKVEFLKPLHSTLQSYKIKEAKMTDFLLIIIARSQKTAHPSRSAYSSCANTVTLPLPLFCGCGPCTIQDRVLQSVSPLFTLAIDGKQQ